MADTVTVQTSEMKYRTVVTDIGHRKEAAVAVDGPKLNIVEAAVGDGGGSEYIPTGSETALVNEVWRGPIASMAVNENSPNMYDVRTILDSTVGGFTVREVGLFDDEGNLIVIANYPPTAKAVILEGFSAKLDILLHVLFTNPDNVSFTIDPNVDSVSTAAMNEAIQAHNEDAAAHAGIVREQSDDVQAIITESLTDTGSEENIVYQTVVETVQNIIVEKLSDTDNGEDENVLQQTIVETVQNVFQTMVQSGDAVDQTTVQQMLDDNAGGNITFVELTVPASGWVPDETSGIYTNTVVCDKATADSMPFVSVYHESASTAAACGLVSGAETADGAVIFQSESVPDADISAIAVLMREGAVNSGSSYVLPAATTNTLGGVKAGSGLTIDSDGVLSVNTGTDSDITSMF